MLEQKQKDYNWYYSQCFVEVDGFEYKQTLLFVTFAKTPDEAKNLAFDYVMENASKERRFEGQSIRLQRKDIHLYQKNYIREARGMVASGKFAGVKPVQV